MTGPVIEFSDDFDAVGFYLERMARYDSFEDYDYYEGGQ